MTNPTKRDVPGTPNVGEFSPLVTPERPGEVVTTRQDQAQNHRQSPDNSAPDRSATKTWMPNTDPVNRK